MKTQTKSAHFIHYSINYKLQLRSPTVLKIAYCDWRDQKSPQSSLYIDSTRICSTNALLLLPTTRLHRHKKYNFHDMIIQDKKRTEKENLFQKVRENYEKHHNDYRKLQSSYLAAASSMNRCGFWEECYYGHRASRITKFWSRQSWDERRVDNINSEKTAWISGT